MSDETSFTIRLEESDGGMVAHCTGKLVSSTTGGLHACVKPLVAARRRVVLDLRDVTFMDSMGLGAIATLYVSAKTAGCPFEVVNLRPRIRDLFTVTHLLSLFEPCGSSNAIIP
jgi:anti-sigma B factor antagonist